MTIPMRFTRAFGGVFLFGAMFVIVYPTATAADPERVVLSDWGHIERLHSAWMADAMGIHHTAPFVNSKRFDPITATIRDECTAVNDGYATDPADPGHRLHHAILLGAYLHGKQVRLALQGCSYDHPRIIGVEVRD